MGWATLPARRGAARARSSRNLVLWGFYGPFIMQAWLIINLISSPSLLPKDGGAAENSKLRTLAWSFQQRAHVLKLSRSHQETLEQRHSYHTGNSKGSRSSVSGTGGQRPIYIFSIISRDLFVKVWKHSVHNTYTFSTRSPNVWLFQGSVSNPLLSSSYKHSLEIYHIDSTSIYMIIYDFSDFVYRCIYDNSIYMNHKFISPALCSQFV